MKTRYYVLTIIILLGYGLRSWGQSTNQNYIVTKTMSKNDNVTSRDVVQYYDGLGRPNEIVQRKFTPLGYDLVTRKEYDNFGRESRDYLPIPSSNTNGYYNGQSIYSIAPSKYGNDSYTFSETIYEASPLNRVNKQFGAGNDWRSADRYVKTEYLTNSTSTAELKCALYTVSGNNLVRGSGALYSSGTLYVTKLTDENNNVSYEFKDKLNRVVLQRQINDGQNYDTYFVYDDFGNLSFVLPPLAADNTPGGTYNETSDPINKYAYLYRYDNRNRCTEKKLPGAGWISMVYDKADRLVITQNAEQKGKQWAFFKYDALGRMVLSGYKLGNDAAFQQEKSQCTNGLVVENFSIQNGVIYRYSNISPLSITSSDVRVVNYYDNYDWRGQFNDDGTPDLTGLTYSSKTGFGVQYGSAQGLLTGTYTRLLDASARSVSANYYDYRGQVIQNCLINMKGGYDRTFFNYNFDGTIDKKQSEETGMSPQPNVTELYQYGYDTQGRLTSTDYSLNGIQTPLSRLAYNELSQLTNKTTGNLETTSYSYNIRNWLAKQTGSRFSQQLYYTSSPSANASPNFNGNITAQWTSSSEYPTARGYLFQYDNLNRMTASWARQGTSFDPTSQMYDEWVGYDKQGNFRYIERNGRLDNGSYGRIDDLDFQVYDGNRVTRIHDYIPDNNNADLMEFKNVASTIEYTYDGNGNMTSDLNKKISLIQYNELNLPKRIDFQNGNWIEYGYDASSVKHKVKHYIVKEGIGTTTTMEYVGNKIFKDGQLDRILTEEGYVTRSGSTYNSFYYLKDHLGNNRIVMNSTGGVVQASNYYPFGLTQAESQARTDQGVQPYKYNGKELDRDGGLDAYDYSARMYSPAIGRFMTQDPMAEKYYSISPYAYCLNNPVKFIDPTGEYVWIYYKDEEGNEQRYNFNPNEEYTGDNTFIKSVYEAYNYMQENGVDELSVFDNFTGNENTSIDIRQTSEKNGGFKGNSSYDFRGEGEQNVGTISWNPNLGVKFKQDNGKEGRISPSVGLLHEMGHAKNASEGIIGFALRNGISDSNFGNAEEASVILNVENPAAQTLGQGIRVNHKGKGIMTMDVNSTMTLKEYKKLQKIEKK